MADREAAEQRVRALAATIARPTTDLGAAGRFAVVTDPVGATFQLLQVPTSGAGAGRAI